MTDVVTEHQLLEAIRDATRGREEFLRFREFVFDLFTGEGRYELGSEGAKDLTFHLVSYLQTEEAFGDPLWKERLKTLHQVLQAEGFALENMILGLSLDRIRLLVQKVDSGVISSRVFAEQMKKLWPGDFNWLRVVDVYRATFGKCSE